MTDHLVAEQASREAEAFPLDPEMPEAQTATVIATTQRVLEKETV